MAYLSLDNTKRGRRILGAVPLPLPPQPLTSARLLGSTTSADMARCTFGQIFRSHVVIQDSVPTLRATARPRAARARFPSFPLFSLPFPPLFPSFFLSFSFVLNTKKMPFFFQSFDSKHDTGKLAN